MSSTETGYSYDPPGAASNGARAGVLDGGGYSGPGRNTLLPLIGGSMPNGTTLKTLGTWLVLGGIVTYLVGHVKA